METLAELSTVAAKAIQQQWRRYSHESSRSAVTTRDVIIESNPPSQRQTSFAFDRTFKLTKDPQVAVTLSISNVHSKARTELNEEYEGKRLLVPDELVPWTVPWLDYNPGSFTAAVVLANARDQAEGKEWADPSSPLELRAELEARTTYSAQAGGRALVRDAISFDADSGAPLNPCGRTGLRGRGLLGKWGPNHAADPIVTRWEPLTGRLQVLAILRNDTREWALPGGIAHSQEDAVSRTVRRSIEHAAHFDDAAQRAEFHRLIDQLFALGTPVFMGYVDDPRNTDNAWMESKAVHFHCSHRLAALLPLNAWGGEGVKAGAVVWLDADAESESRYAHMYGSHRGWVEQAIAKAGLTAHRHGSVRGLHGEGRVFAAGAASLGDASAAARLNLLDRCVKKVISPLGTHVNDEGAPIDVQTFPICRLPSGALKHYGCSVAVLQLLRFARELALVFLLMLVLSAPALADHRARSQLRNECRAQLEDAAAYAALTAADPPAGSLAARCGYAGRDIEPNLTASTPLLLGFALGACTEFSTQTVGGEGALLRAVFGDDAAELVGVPSARFCVRSPTASWLEAACVGVLLGFLWWQRRVSRLVAEETDQQTVSASDYAVMIAGLDANVSPEDENGTPGPGVHMRRPLSRTRMHAASLPGLESRLYLDLERLGFSGDDVAYIEIAVECAREARLLRTLAKLQVEKQEQQMRRRELRSSTDRGGRSSLRRSSLGRSTDLPASNPTIERAIDRCQKALHELHLEPQRSTGHAFVVFQLEESRNRFVRIFELPTWRSRLRKRYRASVSRWAARLAPAQAGLQPERSLSRGRSSRGRSVPPAPGEAQDVGVEELGQGGQHGAGFSVRSSLRFTVSDLSAARRQIALLEAASYRQDVEVTAAPEPSDVRWENLHVSDVHRRRVAWVNLAAVVLVMGLSALLILAATMQEEYLTKSAEGYLTSAGTLFSLLATLISVCTNYMLKRTCTALTQRERPSTTSGYELSLYTKLAPAYIMNTCGVAFLVACLRGGALRSLSASEVVTLRWFEPGGLVEYVTLSLCFGALPDLLGALRFKNLLDRHVLARFVTSQHKLNRLWRPPRMPVGRLYATLVKDLSLCLVFGPLCPIAYLLSALRLALSFWCTLFTITFFYRRPAGLTGTRIMARMRGVLANLVAVGVVVKLFAYPALARPSLYASAALLVLFLMLSAVEGSLGLEDFDALEVGQDLGGIRYDDVGEMTGVELERYQVPEVQLRGGRGRFSRRRLSGRSHDGPPRGSSRRGSSDDDGPPRRGSAADSSRSSVHSSAPSEACKSAASSKPSKPWASSSSLSSASSSDDGPRLHPQTPAHLKALPEDAAVGRRASSPAARGAGARRVVWF